MRHLRTIELGSFPLAAALSLIVVIPCAAMLHLLGTVNSTSIGLTALLVGVLGSYALGNLYAWAGMFAAEWSMELLGRAASSRTPAPTVDELAGAAA